MLIVSKPKEEPAPDMALGPEEEMALAGELFGEGATTDKLKALKALIALELKK